MSFDYTDLRDNDIEPLLAEFGKPATLRQPGTPTGDEWDPTPGAPTDYAVTVLEGRFSAQEKAGGLVQEDDRKFIMSTAGDPDPSLKGVLIIGGVTLQVVNMEPVQPGSVALLHRLHCRK